MAESALDMAELGCGRLFDEVPCYISIQDRDLCILQANLKLIDEFGHHPGEFCYRVYKGRPEACPECPVLRTFAHGKEHTSEEKIFDKRGMVHDVIVHTRPLHDPAGQMVAVMELFTDITVQKELEHRLHDSLTRFHHLFDLVPCYLFVQDRDYIVIEANQRFKDSFGARLGQFCYKMCKRRREPCTVCPVRDTFQDGQVHSGEDVLIDLAGNEVRVVVHTASIRDPRGDIVAVMKVADDITEMRTLQDKLAYLGRLVSGTAHSIKNVLAGLRGGVYVVNLGFRDNNQQDICTGWEMVERNVGRLSSMILDMLYCAKERVPRRLPVSLPAVAHEVVQLFSPRAAEFSVALQTEISDAVPDLPGEPKDIHALVSNLVGNAIDACLSEESEEKACRVLVRVFRQNQHALLEVSDNGPGMDEETRSKLFTMLFSTKGTFGTGLGLLVSHKVATEHGGAIAVRSGPGQGATFTVRLPLEITPS